MKIYDLKFRIGDVDLEVTSKELKLGWGKGKVDEITKDLRVRISEDRPEVRTLGNVLLEVP